MTQSLDHLLARLAAAPADRRLAQLEPTVWARIVASRPDAGQAWGWRAAMAALLLTTGALAGAAASARPHESSPFSIHAPLAPSTLLEGGQ